MPVCNYDGEVIGVAQIVNKRDHTDEEDEGEEESEEKAFKDGGDGSGEFDEADLKVGFAYKTLPQLFFSTTFFWSL